MLQPTEQYAQYIIEDLEQGSLEWKTWRNSKIGASDAASILGIGFHTPAKLYEIKTGRIEVEDNERMKRGRDKEEEARQAFIEEMGVVVVPTVVTSLSRPWQAASLDGLSLDGKIAVEVKVPGSKDHELALSGVVPPKYFPQLQHQMVVLNLEFMYYFSWNEKSSVTLKIKRDDVYCEMLIKKEYEFYTSLINNEPPKELYVQKNESDWIALANEWRNLCAQDEEIQKRKEDCKNAFIHLANQQNSEGAGIRLQKISVAGRVDYSKIPELEKVNLEYYRKPGTESFRITEIKG
jgi:putative phage-type endonuclease